MHVYLRGDNHTRKRCVPIPLQLQAGDLAPHFRLLELFAFGVWPDYISEF
jgi:hypothetical protein